MKGNYYWRYTHFSLNHDYWRKGNPCIIWKALTFVNFLNIFVWCFEACCEYCPRDRYVWMYGYMYGVYTYIWSNCMIHLYGKYYNRPIRVSFRGFVTNDKSCRVEGCERLQVAGGWFFYRQKTRKSTITWKKSDVNLKFLQPDSVHHIDRNFLASPSERNVHWTNHVSRFSWKPETRKDMSIWVETQVLWLPKKNPGFPGLFTRFHDFVHHFFNHFFDGWFTWEFEI